MQQRCVRTLARNLKHLRKVRHFSQQYLSELSGVSRATILHIEAMKSASVTLNTLMKLAEALDVSVSDFFIPLSPTSVRNSNMLEFRCGSEEQVSVLCVNGNEEDRNQVADVIMEQTARGQ